MAREEIRKLLEESKGRLEADHDGFAKLVHDELESSKRRTLDQI